MSSALLSKSRSAWLLLLLSLILFILLAIGNLFRIGQSVAEKNVLNLSLAFNDLDRGLQQFLTSREMSGFDELKAANQRFNDLMDDIKAKNTSSALGVLPSGVVDRVSGADLSKFDFGALQTSWGQSKKSVDTIIENAQLFASFQESINKTQARNKVMQEDYKKLIAFLVENYFSGNKVAVIQRQPWLADRISLRLLWLQRPLAFSPKSIDVLKTEAGLFAQSSIALLEQQLSEVAKESDELDTILKTLKNSINQYLNELKNVSVTGDRLIAKNMHEIVQKSGMSNVSSQFKMFSKEGAQKAVHGLLSPFVKNLMFWIALLSGLIGACLLRRKWKKAEAALAQGVVKPSAINSSATIANDMTVKEPSMNINQVDSAELAIEKSMFDDAVDDAKLNNQAAGLAAEASVEPKEVIKTVETVKWVETDFTPLFAQLDAIRAGDLTIKADESHPQWGGVSQRVNNLTHTIAQLVKAVDISSKQMALAAQQNQSNAWAELSGINLPHMQQTSHVLLERMKILDLNFKIKMGSEQLSKNDLMLLSEDVRKLKLAGEQLNQEMSASHVSEQSIQEPSQAFANNLMDLSEKLKSLIARFNQ